MVTFFWCRGPDTHSLEGRREADGAKTAGESPDYEFRFEKVAIIFRVFVFNKLGEIAV